MAATAIGKLRSARIGPWKGMNEKVAVPPPGVASNLQNVLLDEIPGVVVKRPGTRALTALPSGLPPRDIYVFTKLDGTAYLLISDGENLYYTTDPSGAYPAAIKTGLNPDGFMSFETAENKVWLSNGIDAVMSWDGTTLLEYDRSYTSTTNLTTVGTTSFIHAGLGAVDDYWNGQELVFIAGANIGTVVTVTNYVGSSGTITFTPAVASIAATDRFIVGVEIPRGAALRYYDGRLFSGCTADNRAELRFHEISDPDTGEIGTIANPRAWPAANELALTVLDQEKLYGISPILRDRILVHKASGIWRLERDALTGYRLELVSRAIGSRFPDTWAEKNNILYFLGQDKDGLPEVYKTDMVDVNLVDPDGGVEPTLRGLQQPTAIQSSRTFTSRADFNAGTRSTLADAENGELGVGAFDSIEEWEENLVSGSNVDIETTPGSVAVLGIPHWADRYEAAALPAASVPAWTVGKGNAISEAVAGGILTVQDLGVGSSRTYNATRYTVADSTKDAFVTLRFQLLTVGSGLSVIISNGVKQAAAFFGAVSCEFNTGGLPALLYKGSGADQWYTAHILLKSDGTSKLWLNRALLSTNSPTATSDNLLQIVGSIDPGAGFQIDYIYDHFDFKGDQLSSQGSKVSPVALPDTLPLAGNIVVVNDLTRTPDALRVVYQNSTLNGGTVGLESWTSGVVGFTSDNDAAGYVAVANGAVPTSLVKRAQRLRVTLTALDSANSPVVTALYSGMLWLSPAVSMGSAITAWRTFLSTLTTPAGSAQTIQIRRTTVTTTPVEADWGGWAAIVNGDNIGTILADVVPTSTYIQFKVEQGVAAAGDVPSVEAAVAQWTNGSGGNLPVRAVVHKQRYLISAATALAATNDIIIVCDRNDQWTKFSGLAINAMAHFQGNLYGADAGDASMSQMDVEDVYNDYGAAIDAFLETREEDLDEPHLRKNIRYSYLQWSRAAAAATLLTFYKRSGDTAYTGSGSFTFGADGQDVRQNFSVGTVGKRLQRKYQNATLDENMALEGEVLYYDVRPGGP